MVPAGGIHVIGKAKESSARLIMRVPIVEYFGRAMEGGACLLMALLRHRK